MTLYIMKEDVGLMDSIKKNFEDISSDMVAMLHRVQQLFPYLMLWGKAVCGNMNMIMSDSSSYSC